MLQWTRDRESSLAGALRLLAGDDVGSACQIAFQRKIRRTKSFSFYCSVFRSSAEARRLRKELEIFIWTGQPRDWLLQLVSGQND